jgi:hypothetical protein
MRTTLTILGIAGGVVLLLLLGVAIAVWTVDPNQFIGPIQARIKSATGRDLAIGGGIELKLGLEPKLVVNDVASTARWAKTPDMLWRSRSGAGRVAAVAVAISISSPDLVDRSSCLRRTRTGRTGSSRRRKQGGPAGDNRASVAISDLTITRGARIAMAPPVPDAS